MKIRFYSELNDFLPEKKQYVLLQLELKRQSSIKDIIESMGIPHTEVDLIIINGISVDFSYIAKNEDFISVYPKFESLDIRSILKIRKKPLRRIKFVLDQHLGKLTRYLRMYGCDSLYKNDFSDVELSDISSSASRIVLTRDVGLLKRSKVTHGYWVRSTIPREQLIEIIQRFDLKNECNLLSRCIICNGIITDVNKEEIIDQIPTKTALYYKTFYRCTKCKKIYWRGSHYENMEKFINEIFLEIGFTSFLSYL